ncbi:hypothetical protein KIJ11_08840 [Leuconostoc gelidum subsp. gelidum]|uniref:Uncharacterized protein n=1 Tax=Leuconostoc gelidum subsp. gelidum TaxID=1607839 RepID=A0AB35G1F0_LEUGE|nr:hypothetical protein [Leuconostoc gelidum]MBZ5964599.1 hypothetical protein [Leuconostoc gelidum subsp. gelidum]MBZ5974796.1 hypothetical protein [Leuconostoc gelidum subsp. gelidum]MBZ5977636.1 hypothetical protein [Leuconostoc gelidum subsp. gelidum]MBZ5986426.1 hypothetical protein [Leuconostoc gelidum subsp. gelidum]MBZ5999347.1 hypothetical protein [Leuconostoc gelidum subsp. gelidum]
MDIEIKNQCMLCHDLFENSELSAEHYPAKSVGNNDIVALDLVKMFDFLLDKENIQNFFTDIETGKEFNKKLDMLFDNELSTTQYPRGRVAYTLCRSCNTFLGKYDEAYKKFFDSDGNPKVVSGFVKQTKIKIIKAIYAKFLSLPECSGIKFDFIDYLKSTDQDSYDGLWQIYFLKRSQSTDILNMRSLDVGVLNYDEGQVFELSDEKFIFHLTNFKPKNNVTGINLFSIQNKYVLVGGENIDGSGGYHGEMIIKKMLDLEN